VRGLACSLVVLGHAMFWCIGAFQDSGSIPGSLVRRTGAPTPADAACGPAAWVAPGRITH